MRRPKVKLDNFFTVIMVEEKHDISRAAAEMGLTPSAVRKQIEGVESVLGARLFTGKKGELSLTEEGRVFHAEAVESVEHALLAEEKTFAILSLKSHRLLLGHSTYLPPKLIALISKISIQETPRVRIRHVSGLTSDLVRQVLEGCLHLGIAFLPLQHPDLLVHPFYAEPLVACIPSGSALAARASIYPNDLDGEPVIALSRGPMPLFHKEIEDYFSGFGIELNVVADAFAPPEALTYVAQGTGICFLAGTSVTPRPGVTVRPLSNRVLMRRSGIFIREDSRSPLIQKLVDTVLQQAKLARL